MRVVAGALRELLGLFVEDAGYALAILAWVAIAAVAFRYVDPVWRGAAFAAGFIIVLLAGVVRATRAP